MSDNISIDAVVIDGERLLADIHPSPLTPPSEKGLYSGSLSKAIPEDMLDHPSLHDLRDGDLVTDEELLNSESSWVLMLSNDWENHDAAVDAVGVDGSTVEHGVDLDTGNWEEAMQLAHAIASDHAECGEPKVSFSPWMWHGGPADHCNVEVNDEIIGHLRVEKHWKGADGEYIHEDSDHSKEEQEATADRDPDEYSVHFSTETGEEEHWYTTPMDEEGWCAPKAMLAYWHSLV